jgi:chaperonin cofactor prefoldin
MKGRAHIAVFLLAALTGCEDRPQRWSESEIREIARNEAEIIAGGAANAASVDMIVEDLAQRNAELELQVENLEAQARDHRAEIDAIHAELDAARY